MYESKIIQPASDIRIEFNETMTQQATQILSVLAVFVLIWAAQQMI